MKLNDSVTVHDAVTSWTENINTKNFTVCAMQSGRKGKNFNPFATLDWMAYQGAPRQGLTGNIKLQKWWSGTNCANVTFPKVQCEHVYTKITFFYFCLMPKGALNFHAISPNAIKYTTNWIQRFYRAK